MRYLRDFVTKMLAVQVLGIIGLLVGGWILTQIQRDNFCPQQTFFTYQIEHLDRTPAWFVFVLIQLAVNGFWMFRLAVLEGGVMTPRGGPFGNWDVQIPINYLRVFAVNLIVVPASLFAFMFVRYTNW